MVVSNYWFTERKPKQTNIYSTNKLAVVRTSMDRMGNVVTEEADQREEELNTRTTLAGGEYAKWALDMVKQQMGDKPQQPKSSMKSNQTPSKSMVVISYVEGVAEKRNTAFQKRNVSTAMRPSNTQEHPRPS